MVIGWVQLLKPIRPSCSLMYISDRVSRNCVNRVIRLEFWRRSRSMECAKAIDRTLRKSLSLLQHMKVMANEC